LENVGDARVTVVASTSEAARRIVPAGCAIEANWRAVASAKGVNAVLIAAPASLHAAMAVAALVAEKAVFVEKPVALTPADARRVAARAEGRIFRIDHLDLWNPAWRAVKGALHRIGKPARVEATFGAADGRVDVSPLWDWGPHAVALCIDLLGRPNRVKVLADGTVELGFATACPAKISLGNRFPERARRLVIAGEGGTLTYDDNAEIKAVLRTSGTETALPYGSERPLTVALESFLSEVRTGRPSFADAELGVLVVDVLADASAQKVGASVKG
jgi:predicted dehydrogenase